jgi:hypothetical protein
MGIFQILFVVINLALPAYFLTRTSQKAPSAAWGLWEKSMSRLIDSDGGFPGCSTLDLVSTLEDLCETSHLQLTPRESVSVERTSAQLTFYCEYTKQSIRVGWRLQDNKDATLKCRDPGGAMAPHAPGFTFALNGRMRSMEFNAEDGSRQSLPAINCRRKVAAIKDMTPPHELDQLFQVMGHSNSDPPDYLTGNFMCFVFDLSPLWSPWRDRFRR